MWQYSRTPRRMTREPMRSTPPIPKQFRQFAIDGYTNVFCILPSCPRFYATETLFGDWDAPVLLLAKDAAPAHVIRDLARTEGVGAWRHAQRHLGDRGGWRTNERLTALAGKVP